MGAAEVAAKAAGSIMKMLQLRSRIATFWRIVRLLGKAAPLLMFSGSKGWKERLVGTAEAPEVEGSLIEPISGC